MKAMILAAGRGERMRPLTDHTPKPLLKVASKPLIEYHLEALAKCGFRDIVINLSYLGNQIREYVGSGTRYGLKVVYSLEGEPPLETAGGIVRALPMLGDDSFIVINADIWTDFDFSSLSVADDDLAHLVMIENPLHNTAGDFCLNDGRVFISEAHPAFTFSGIGVYRKRLFTRCPEGPLPLAPILRQAMSQGLVSGQLYRGQWCDIGTPERLQQLDRRVRAWVSTET